MAFTKLYLTTATAPYTPATIRGAWNDTAGAVTRALEPSKASGGALTTIARAETDAAANYDVLLYRGVSGPLAAQTISGTVDVVLGVWESAVAADFAYHLHIYVTQGNSDTVRGTLLADYVETTGNEWPTLATGRALAAAQTLTNIGAITAGDRLVVEIGYVALNASATSYTGTLNYGTQLASNEEAPDLVTAGTDVTVKAGFLQFSVSITEDTLTTRVTSVPTLATTAGTAPVRVTTASTLVTAAASVIRAAASLVLVTTSSPPPGGGGGGGGTNPPQGAVPTSAPEVFVVFTLDGVDYPFGVGQLNDDPTWFGGKKTSKIKDISSIKYQLTKQGGPQAVSFTVTVFDGDRVFHDRAGTTNQIAGGFCAVYVIEHSARLAEGVPKRLGAGYITKYVAKDDFTFTFTVKDALSTRIAKIDKEPTFPPGRFTLTDFPGLDPAMDGRAIPLVLGTVSDASAAVPQGEVPAIYLGQVNLSVFGGINKLCDTYVWAQGAFVNNGIVSVWYNPANTPLVRSQSPTSAFGTIAWTPFWPEWSADTGFPNNYADYNGRRWSPIYIDASLTEAPLIKSGAVLIAANIHGTEDVGDTTGATIDSPAYLIIFTLVNYVFSRYLLGAYASMPEYTPQTTTAYSWIDTASFDDVNNYFIARLGGTGYVCGMLAGAGGEPMTVAQFLQEMCSGAWIDIGVNFDGQLMASVFDPNDAAVDTFDAVSDIATGSYSVTLNEQRNINRIEYQYAKYYLPPYAPAPTPAAGDPAPSTPIPDYPEYRSGVKVLEDLPAQTAIGEIITFVHQNNVVRIAAVADDVAVRILEEAQGPTGYGPHEFTLKGGWQLISNVTLGKNINVKHPAKAGTGAIDLCRVTTIDIYPLQHSVVLGGDVIDHNA